MSALVTTELFAQPRLGDDVAWRTEHGFTATFEAMLTGPW